MRQLAVRDSQTIAAQNCTAVQRSEVQQISANLTFHTGVELLVGQTYQICVGSRVGVRAVHPSGGWPNNHVANLDLQKLSSLRATWAINSGQGVYRFQEMQVRAQTAGLPVTIRRAAFEVSPGGMPLVLEMAGPLEGSTEVRGVPFVQQPVVRVLGINGELHPDVTGRIQITAVGGTDTGACTPQITSALGTVVTSNGVQRVSAPLINGVAAFAGLRVDTTPCLGQPIHLEAEVQTGIDALELAADPAITLGNAPLLQLASVTTALFNITHGAAAVLDLSLGNRLLTYNPALTCLQTFRRGEAYIQVTVRDAQGSPVVQLENPIDLRLCEAAEAGSGSTAPICPSRTSALTGTVQMHVDTNGIATFNNFSVTNVSYSHVLQLYSNLLPVANTEPFSACDDGTPQILRFVRRPSSAAKVGQPLPLQPALELLDGFGRRLLSPSVFVYLNVRAPWMPPRTDASSEAQLSGVAAVHTTLSDPLQPNESLKVNFQHAVFEGIQINTRGTWIFDVWSPSVLRGTVSEHVYIEPGDPIEARFTHSSPSQAQADVPVSPPIEVMLFDVGGNNVSREDANVTVTLSMEPSPGLNSGRMAGETRIVGAYGLATFANISFDDAATLKHLTATSDNPWGSSLVTASPAVVRVLPGPPAFLVVRSEPRAIYGVSPVSAAAAAVTLTNVVSAEVQDARQQIQVSVALVDALGNDACTSLMEPSECTLTSQGLAVGLTLVHDEWYNYTVGGPRAPPAGCSRSCGVAMRLR